MFASAGTLTANRVVSKFGRGLSKAFYFVRLT